jgi:hypothetical protein
MRAHTLLSATALALLATLSVSQASPEAPAPHAQKLRGDSEHLLELRATIRSIDRATRHVVLRTTEGKDLALTVGPEVKRFAEIEVGDHVVVKYYESLTLSLAAAPNAMPSKEVETHEARNPPHQLPGGVKAKTTMVTAKVLAIDTHHSKVTVLGPHGDSITLAVDPATLSRLAVGDTVSAVFTEAMAVGIERGAFR